MLVCKPVTCSEVLFGAGVVHCQLNPGNTVLTPCVGGFSIKLTGFEASQVCANNGYLFRWMRETPYTAPEVSQCKYTAAADIWSLGRILCWLLSGHVPCGVGGGKLHCEQVMWG